MTLSGHAERSEATQNWLYLTSQALTLEAPSLMPDQHCGRLTASSTLICGVDSFGLAMQGETFNAPEPCPAGATLPELVSCVQGLLDVFVANGFAIKVRAQHTPPCHPAGAVQAFISSPPLMVDAGDVRGQG